MLFALVFACGGTAPVPLAVKPPVAAAPAPEPPPAPAPVAAPVASGPAVIVDKSSFQPLQPLAEGGHRSLRLAVARTAGGVSLVMDGLVAFCDPAPTFTSALGADVLDVTLAKPDGSAKCSGDYHVEAHVELPATSTATRVVVHDEVTGVTEAPVPPK